MSLPWNEVSYSTDTNQVIISAPGPQGPQGPSSSYADYSASAGAVTSASGVPTRWYGSFYDTTTQSASGVNMAHPIRLGSSDSASTSGVRVSSSSIIVDHSGIYNIQFSAQIDTTKATVAEIWLRKNGHDVPWSNTQVATSNQAPKRVAAWNFVATANAGDWFQLMWSTNDVATVLGALSSSSYSPAVPSVIVTVTQV